MMNILENVPHELKRKIISFFPRPSHFVAYKTGVKPVFNNELLIDIDEKPIKLVVDDIDQEWYDFINNENTDEEEYHYNFSVDNL